MSRHFPKINDKDAKTLITVSALVMEDEGYLDDPLCPYGLNVRKLLSQFQAITKPDRAPDDELDLEKETKDLYLRLKEYEKSTDESDTQAKNTFFRTASVTLEKMLGLIAQAKHIRQVEQFEETMLRIMEEELPVDTRNRIMERLESLLH